MIDGESLSYLIPLVSGLSTLILGIMIILEPTRGIQHRAFFAFSVTISFWLLGSSVMLLQCHVEHVAILIDRIIYIAVVAIPPTLVHFITIFTKQQSKKFVRTGYILMLFFWGVIWSPAFINGLHVYQNSCHSSGGILHHFFLLYFGVYISSVFYFIRIAKKRTAIGEVRVQLDYIFWAILLLAIVGTSAFLSAYGIETYLFSYLSGLLSSIVLAFAIFKHKLFNTRLVTTEVIVLILILIFFIRFISSYRTDVFYENGLFFLIVTFAGFFVVKSVLSEIHNREKGERLARYLANANARLREIDKQKTEFVSIASHQLRAPIAAIKGYSSMIIEGTFGEVPKHLEDPLNRVLESGKRIAIIVDDFLNVTRIEQGRMVYAMSHINMCALVKDVAEDLAIVAKNKGLEFTVTVEDPCNATVYADDGKIRQVCSNVIDNAIKYTDTGFVHVEVHVTTARNAIIVSVSDSGIGIPVEEQGVMFHKFSRASNANESTVHGTGLGLYIAKEIIRAHNGWIHISSPGVGKGTTFTIELPLEKSEG